MKEVVDFDTVEEFWGVYVSEAAGAERPILT